MKNGKLKILIIFLIMFSCTLFFNARKTLAIYKEVKSTTISMSVVRLSCTVNLELNGGTGISSQDTVIIGDYYVPGTPTKTDSIFVGWYTDSGTTIPYDSTVPISTTTLTLYAKWTTINYVADVEGVGLFETLAEAFENVPTTGIKTKVTLLQDVTFTLATDCVTVNNNQYVDFDLNGHTVNGGSAAILFTVSDGAKLEVGSSNGTGYINNTGNKMAINVNGDGNNNEGILYLKNGASINSSGSATAISNRGDFYMTGGSITCSSVQAAVNTGVSLDQSIPTAQFIMTGGSITTSNAEKNQAVYNSGGSRVEISGDSYLYSQSSISGKLRATVHNLSGVVVITGGTIVSKNYSAVLTGTGNSTYTTIGSDDGTIDTTTPVLRGYTYGLEGTNAKIYDGIFESETNNRAINVTNITKPNVNFYDTTVLVSGNSYYATYLEQLTYTVNFYTEIGSTPIVRVINSGSAIGTDMPSDPTKNDYYFDGWYDSNTLINSTTVPVSNINAYAKWLRSISLATIDSTLSVRNESSGTIVITEDDIEERTFTSNDTSIATVDGNGVVTGVDEGTTTITITGVRSGDTRTVTVTITPKIYDINFYDDDGQTTLYPSVSVAEGDTVGADMPNNPTKAGYVFDGWVFTFGNSLTPFTSATEVYGDIDVMATWKEAVSNTTFDSNMTIVIGISEQINLPATTGNRPVENYTITSNDSHVVEVNNHTIYGTNVGSVTLTITGSQSETTKTITVNVISGYFVVFKDDEDNVLDTITISSGNSIDDEEGVVLPNNPTKSGYTFDDWYLYDGNSVTTTRLDTSEVVTTNLVYKPRWAGENDVAAIGTTYYQTYKLAIDAVPTTGEQTEVRLLKDVTVTGFSNNRGLIDKTKNVILNGNHHIMTCGGGNAIWNLGILTIKDITVTCSSNNTAPIDNGNQLTVIDSTVTAPLTGTGGRAAIYNGANNDQTTFGSVTIKGNSIITSKAKGRSAVQNAVANTSIDIQGGTITQEATDSTKYAVEVISGTTATISGGTITSVNNRAVSNTGGTLTITGGTIISESGDGVYNTGTLTIGTINNTYDATTPIIQGKLYGINSTVNYSIYDGIIKGKSNSRAVNDFNKITGTEDSHDRVTDTEDDYYTLYYEYVPNKYRITFEGNGGTVSNSNLEFDLNEPITVSDLATATKGLYTFNGWYTDVNRTIPFTTFTPTVADSVTYYADWSYTSTLTPVSHISTSDAMTYYFNNVSSWASADAEIAANQDQSLDNDDHSTYLDTMLTAFNSYSCSECEITTIRDNMNSCNSPNTGTYCDQPKGFDTGISDDLDVYLYENNTISGSKLNGTNPGEYILSDNGIIYNMIPGLTYYWESQNDSSIYGVVSVTKDGTNYRRTIKSSIRNLRDLGGIPVSYIDNGVTINGTIKYEKLYRGSQNSYGQVGINELQALGITREVDLRSTGDGNSIQAKFSTANYDVSLSDNLYTRFYNQNTYQTDLYKDVKTINYIINPIVNTYFQDAHADNFYDLKQAMKAIMRQVVNHEVVYFHCTIGSDITGTVAYFLEGLLGVSNEDRLRDYEMTYFYGLTNRSRFHNNLRISNINPRFYAMYKSYSNISDIEDLYFNYYPESDDESLLAAFRTEMIQ